jgi:negative regulator of flagellin synthesis FlgM
VKINGTGGFDAIKAYSSQLKKADANKKASEQARGDTIEISPEAREMRSYRPMLDKLPPVREDLVVSLKQRIQDGTYQPDDEKIAAGVIKESRLDQDT